MALFLRIVLVVGVLVFGAGSVCAQPDLTIGEIDLPTFSWGEQATSFEVTNNSAWMKYVTVATEISFAGAYLTPRRTNHSHFPIEPGETRLVNPIVEVPGNYGKATLFIRIYEAIDTLDALMESQKLFEQGFKLTFHVPNQLSPYFQEKVTLPPMVKNNPIWDNEFAHVLPLLLSEGKSLEEVASLTESELSFVKGVVDKMVLGGFLYRNKDRTIVPNFPVFRTEHAQKVKDLAGSTSDQMADFIEKNMPDYQRVLDSMVAAGSLTKDVDDFLHGGTVLYRKYPVVGGLLLWYDMGRSFITGRAPLEVFKQTDPCNAMTGQYMYAVHGGDYFNGHHYYKFSRTQRQYDIDFGDEIPSMRCVENFHLKKLLREKVDYNYTEEYRPEAFMVSATLVEPALNALSAGSEVVFRTVRDDLTVLSEEAGFSEVSVAERYWFWNLFATRTLKKLVDRKVLDRVGNGQFDFNVSE